MCCCLPGRSRRFRTPRKAFCCEAAALLLEAWLTLGPHSDSPHFQAFSTSRSEAALVKPRISSGTFQGVARVSRTPRCLASADLHFHHIVPTGYVDVHWAGALPGEPHEVVPAETRLDCSFRRAWMHPKRTWPAFVPPRCRPCRLHCQPQIGRAQLEQAPLSRPPRILRRSRWLSPASEENIRIQQTPWHKLRRLGQLPPCRTILLTRLSSSLLPL